MCPLSLHFGEGFGFSEQKRAHFISRKKKNGKRDCDLHFHMQGGGTNPVPMEQWLHCTTHNLESEGGSRPNHRPNSPQMVVWMEDQMGAFRGMKLSPHLWFLFIMFWIVIYIHACIDALYAQCIWIYQVPPLAQMVCISSISLSSWTTTAKLLGKELLFCAFSVWTFRFYTITTGMSVALSKWIIAPL